MTALRPLVAIRQLACAARFYSTPKTTAAPAPDHEKVVEDETVSAAEKQKSTKTQAQLDQELMEKMAGLSGDGGEAGVELENGVPVSMKRSVKNNMFRYI